MTVSAHFRLAILGLFCCFSLTFGAAARSRAVVMGWVEDAVTHERLGWANVMLAEAECAITTADDGSFCFCDIPTGVFTLRASRIGYREAMRMIAVSDHDTLKLTVLLGDAPLQLGEVKIITQSDSHGAVHHDPVVELRGGDLQRQLAPTIAATVENEPGVAQRSMGPAPARPVLHGLGGDRLLMLEDGLPTGDLSASSADHAVAIEPMTAERIEVTRGPETLLDGPGVLGGVINVKRGSIVRVLPRQATGAITIQSESVNKGLAGGLNGTLPLGSWVLRADGSRRSTDDMQTPDGTLHNTSICTGNGALGVSLIRPWGVLGAAANLYESKYGIPGGFVGAHPNGVSIELNRRRYELLGEWRPTGALLRRVEAEYAFAHYYHAEFESNGDLGMEFGVLSDHFNGRADLGTHAIFDEGVVGIQVERSNYATGGLTFTPASTDLRAAAYLYEKKRLGAVLLQGSVRHDWRSIEPEEERESFFIGLIHKRVFDGVSASVGAELPTAPGWIAGTTVTRSWRAPTIEELFSEGPHLAAYSYELGNPSLATEHGWGTEFYIRPISGRLQGRAAIFHNTFDGFIFPRNTGHFSSSRADLYEYRYEGQDAEFWGAECAASYAVMKYILVRGNTSYVHGELLDRGSPLPMIPPLIGSVGLEVHLDDWTLSTDLHGAAAQERVDEFEEPTASWARLDAAIQWQRTTPGLLHSVVLSGVNITNTEYRNHLSRVKSVMPESGTNVKLLYRVYL
ncbi:TonB-dependent receptor [bacterium]|nr:TonB-dependent receptor [bacterium]